MEFGEREESEKSNLELLKEEMKLIQKQRGLKYKIKETVTNIPDKWLRTIIAEPEWTHCYVWSEHDKIIRSSVLFSDFGLVTGVKTPG